MFWFSTGSYKAVLDCFIYNYLLALVFHQQNYVLVENLEHRKILRMDPIISGDFIPLKSYYDQKCITGEIHCLKSVHIWSYSGPYFPAFGLNMERYSASLNIQSKCRKIRTRITPNTDTFYAVIIAHDNAFAYNPLNKS